MDSFSPYVLQCPDSQLKLFYKEGGDPLLTRSRAEQGVESGQESNRTIDNNEEQCMCRICPQRGRRRSQKLLNSSLKMCYTRLINIKVL